MGKKAKRASVPSAPDVQTPFLRDVNLAGEGALAFWKRVLPEGEAIDYRHPDGTRQRLDFTEQMNTGLVEAFRAQAMDQTPFVLADEDNRHTMDPERFRGEATDLRRHTELPPDVAQAVADEDGTVAPGLWARIEFASKKAARAVLRNPKLGVSARIRPGDGDKPTRIIHVLGTLDPKVRRLGAWKPALDFSEYAPFQLIDLTDRHYAEAPVSKKTKKAKAPTGTLDLSAVPDIADVTAEDIEKFSEEELAAFLAVYGKGGTNPILDTDPDDDDDDPDDDLSETGMSDIQLAEVRAARKEGREALKRAAAIEWKAERKSLLRDGVPPHVLDLAEPVLSRPYDLVVDLSNTDEGDLDVAKIVRDLVDGYKGTVDLSDVELGHTSDNGTDKDADIQTRFDVEF